MRTVISVGPALTDRPSLQPDVQRLLRAGRELHLRHILLMQRKLQVPREPQYGRTNSADIRSLTPFRFPLPTRSPSLPYTDTAESYRPKPYKRRKRPKSRSVSERLPVKPTRPFAPLSKHILPSGRSHRRVMTTLETVLTSRKTAIS